MVPHYIIKLTHTNIKDKTNPTFIATASRAITETNKCVTKILHIGAYLLFYSAILNTTLGIN